MRREIFRMEQARAIALLRRAPYVHLATTDGEGRPILRAVHGVVVPFADGEALCFHAAPAGEKMEAMGRPVVAGADEIVAEIPSWFSDPERACPATTLYESVQVHGTLEEVGDGDDKARVLQALMERFQPEGRHLPITAEDPRYRSAVRGILIGRIALERVDGKLKVGQNKKPEELLHILEQLWRRGGPGDLLAIERLLEAMPNLERPAFLRGPDGASLHACLPPRAAADAAQLLDGAYWLDGLSRDAIVRAHLGSTAWVGARASDGRLVGSARAISDGARVAWVLDVVVAPAWRRRGLGRALVTLLLDHPALRQVRAVKLHTRDAASLYARFGFQPAAPSPHAQLTLER